MPTVGWIREGDLDAFYEATERVPDPSHLRTPTFACPFCPSLFSTQFELHDHVYAEHRVERPLILLHRGEPATNDIIRAPVLASDVALANTRFARLSIDGSRSVRIDPDKLTEILAGLTQAEVKLELVNDAQRGAAPVTSQYKISFRVAEPRILRGVEKAFTESFVSTEITRHSIGEFLSDKRTQRAGREYASGLAQYCLGILIKERPEGELLTTPLSRYRELYGGALESLKEFHRPLARLITSIIRFSMNEFGQNVQRTGYWELDFASELLLDPSSDALPTSFSSGERRPVCPIDHGTGRMLELASHLAGQARWSPILDDVCRALANSSVLDAIEHQRAFAIWAASAWRLGAKQNAIEPLTQIAEVYPFSRWAREYLEKVPT